MIVAKLLIAFAILAPVLTFWDVGHMLTAKIAELKLQEEDPNALRQFTQIVESINRLCDERTQNFVESAVWPDDLKEEKYKMNLWNSWHFADTPFVTDTVSPSINFTESAMSSIIAVNTSANVLKKNIGQLSAEKALYARYLIHLAGDIHQPLHSVALFNLTYPYGDMGGNRLHVILLNGTDRVLHQFWDSGAFLFQNDSYVFIRPLNEQNKTALQKMAKEFIQEFGGAVEVQGREIDPIIWAQDSFELAKKVVYPHLAKSNKVTQQYSDLTYRTLKRQVVKAGFRLASFIRDIFKEKNVKKSKEEAPQLEEPVRGHDVDKEREAQQVVKKLGEISRADKPDCDDIEALKTIETQQAQINEDF